VHRDVTPANLIITSNGTIKLSDFGVSKSFGDIQLTNVGDIVGSLDYMAPEQARGSSAPDRRSDLYSVGVILYELLTGRRPFGADRKFAPMVTDSEGEPPLPTDVAPHLAVHWNSIVGKALTRNAGARYATAVEFLHAIDEATPEKRRPWSAMEFNRRRFAIAVMSIALAVMLPIWMSIRLFPQISPPSVIPFRVFPPLLALELHVKPALSKEVHPGRRRVPQHRREDEPNRRAKMEQSSITGPTVVDPRAIEQSAPTYESEAVAPKVAQLVTADPELSLSKANDKKEARKSGFWGKLNPFKKRAHAAERQETQ